MDTNLQTHRPYRVVKKAISIQDVARKYTELQTFGGKAWFSGRCPLPDHADRTPSFYIYPSDTGEEAARFHCFGCGSSGDVIELHFRCGQFGEMYEAMLDLAFEYNVELPGPSEGWTRKQHRQRPLRDGVEEVRARIVHRRLYRLFRVSYLDGIEDDDLRREEAERCWQDLAPVARGYARQAGAGDHA